MLVVGKEKGRIAQPGPDDALVSRYNLFWLLTLDIGDKELIIPSCDVKRLSKGKMETIKIKQLQLIFKKELMPKSIYF